ncbi:MAG: helix-turn-helix transcriptional regulator [Victivallales bacterium]|nr:helix-turn-helix transcriptional regulator [Victivallales bacterium]
MESIGLEVTHLSRQSFIELLRHIIGVVGVRKVYFSDSYPKYAGRVSTAVAPRFDITLSGRKHMLFAEDGKVRNIALRPGDIHYAPPLKWKLPLWDRAHEMSSIVFQKDHIRVTYIDFDGSGDFYATHNALVYFHTSRPIGSAGMAVIQALDSLDPGEADVCANTLVQSLLHLVLLAIEREDAPTHRQGKALVTRQRILGYLQENFHHPLTRDQVARAFRLNPCYVSRLFSHGGGASFNATLRKIRIEHVATMLRGTDLTLAEISEHCGYSSQAFIATAFKRHFGCTPGEYRVSHPPPPFA